MKIKTREIVNQAHLRMEIKAQKRRESIELLGNSPPREDEDGDPKSPPFKSALVQQARK